MQRLLRILLCLSLALVSTMRAGATRTDSIVQRIYHYGETYLPRTPQFEARAYLRILLTTKKKGIWMRYVPGLFKLENGQNEYVVEGEAHYLHRPNGDTDVKELSCFSTMPYLHRTTQRNLKNLAVSIYSPSLFDDHILSPLHRRNRPYYRYRILSEYTDSLHHWVRLSIRPRFSNTQLVKGTIDVNPETGAVRNFNFSFLYDMTRLIVTGVTGDEGLSALYPKEMSVNSRLHILGNKVDAYFRAQLTYDFAPPTDTLPQRSRHRYDRSHLYDLRTEETVVERSREHFERIRPLPLTLKEQEIYARFDSLAALPRKTETVLRRKNFWQRTEDFLFDTWRFRVGKTGQLRLPAIISPSMISWSAHRGVTLKSKLRLYVDLPNQGYLSLNPRVGYQFKQAHFYWRTPFELMLLPRIEGRLTADIGNSNRVGNIQQAEHVRDRLLATPEGRVQWEAIQDFNLTLYDNFFFRPDFSVTPRPGLNLSVGLRLDRRRLIRWNEHLAAAGFVRDIHSLAPRFHIEWTPAMYYVQRRRRRIPLYSHFPTFSLDYERAIRSKRYRSDYERIEFDCKYQIDLYALRKLNTRLGAGLYTRRGKSFFLDFDYFRDRNMPLDWDDMMSGNFHTLSSYWYNNSEYYLRASVSYESPMLALSRLRHLSHFIQKEQIYCNAVYLQNLKTYTELGYGFQTHVVDVGAFVGYSRRTGTDFTVRISRALFDGWRR